MQAYFSTRGTDSQMWDQNSPSIADSPQKGDQLGQALAAGTLKSGTGYLAIGVPFEGIKTGGDNCGAVHVLFTDPATGKLTATGSKYYHEDVAGIKDSCDLGGWFGAALGTGDFNNDGDDELAVGAPARSVWIRRFRLTPFRNVHMALTEF